MYAGTEARKQLPLCITRGSGLSLKVVSKNATVYKEESSLIQSLLKLMRIFLSSLWVLKKTENIQREFRNSCVVEEVVTTGRNQITLQKYK